MKIHYVNCTLYSPQVTETDIYIRLILLQFESVVSFYILTLVTAAFWSGLTSNYKWM